MAGALEDVLYGMMAGGLNASTFWVLNASIFLCILCLTILAALSYYGNPTLFPHVVFLIFLATGLLFSFNW